MYDVEVMDTTMGMRLESVSMWVQQEIQLRFLSPEDIPEIKKLCAEWFPIDYPDTWFQEITSNQKFYSLAATYSSKIIGMIVCQVKPKICCNREDQDLLAPNFPPSTQVAYILSLGVVSDFRKHGIASLLLNNLLSYLTSAELYNCKAVYLHVLTTNNVAISFYEKRKFTLHHFLPFYYMIKGSPRDGFSYVLYINGGQPPWTLTDYMKHFGSTLAKLQPCALPHLIIKTLKSVWNRISVCRNSDHQIHMS